MSSLIFVYVFSCVERQRRFLCETRKCLLLPWFFGEMSPKLHLQVLACRSTKLWHGWFDCSASNIGIHKKKLVGAQPAPCCSFARHLVGKCIYIHCSFNSCLRTLSPGPRGCHYVFRSSFLPQSPFQMPADLLYTLKNFHVFHKSTESSNATQQPPVPRHDPPCPNWGDQTPVSVASWDEKRNDIHRSGIRFLF